MNIDDIKYLETYNCITVYDSYKVSKKDFNPFLNSLRDDPELGVDYDCIVLEKRSNCSLINEWTCHNLCYDLGLFKAHTQNVDMQYPLKWWEKIVYPCFGWFCKLFIN